jgi:type IV secretory pathway VirB10-like protein
MKKLKVFQAPFGFYDSVVAVPSMAAALRAWGSRQNLFNEGIAHPVTDETIMKAALEHPGVPLRRPIGTGDPFELEPKGLPNVPLEKKAAEPTPKAHAKPAPADRSALNAAEDALRKLEEGQTNIETEFVRREKQLDDDRARADSEYRSDKGRAAAKIDAERRAYREAGGKD